ncbi:MAG: hypothetical protein ACKV2T_38410 [Kofleriaceae bacterium]
MTTMLGNPALKDARQPLDPEFIDFLAALDENRVTFHRREFRAEFASLTDSIAKFTFEFTTDQRRELIVPWSEAVELELYRRGIALDKPEDEAVRGGKLLLSALAYLDLSFGVSLVDPAIRETISRRFARVPPLRDLIEKTPETAIDRSTPSFRECVSMVTHTIDGYGNSLVLELGYPNREAYAILLGAVYFMFDQRHSLSTKGVMLGEQA